MPHDSLDDIKKYLVMWGEWLRNGSGHRLGYPTSANFVIKTGGSTPVYNEQVAELVELCMCDLKQRHSENYWALYYCYYWELPAFEAASKMNVSKAWYKVRKQNGETWIDALYFSKEFKKVA